MDSPRAPTVFLPPLHRLASCPALDLQLHLQAVRTIYLPHSLPKVIPSTLFVSPRSAGQQGCDTPIIDSGYASADEDGDEDSLQGLQACTAQTYDLGEDPEEDPLEFIRADSFEKTFATKWITGFISRFDNWVAACPADSAEMALRVELLEEALSILSAFTGDEDEAEVALTRSFSFSTPMNDEETHITIELNDAPISSNDHTSVGLQSWGSSILFAERMCALPSTYLPDIRQGSVGKPLRILELGAGTGLLSIAAAKLLGAMHPPPEIVATDYHPDVLNNLSDNVATNFSKSSSSEGTLLPVSVRVLDWENPQYEKPFDEPFDIILASDVIYHPEHAKWIRACVERLLVRPSEGNGRGPEGGIFWLFIPVRTTGRHDGMAATVDALFPHVSDSAGLSEGNGDWRLGVIEREDIERQGGVGRADENAYKLSKIGWIR